MNEKSEKKNEKGRQLPVSILLLFLAIVGITAATTAWFTIADHTRVQSMSLDIFSGYSLRFDLEPHKKLEEYKKTLTFQEICDYTLSKENNGSKKYSLEPVTTRDCQAFTLENGTQVEKNSGKYMEFVLNFMSADDMVVHLTSASSEGKKDGTLVISEEEDFPKALRISFTAGNKTSVYSPGNRTESAPPGTTIFGLPDGDKMIYNDSNALFALKAYHNQPVTVRVWLEGTDQACTDKLRGVKYSIRLRFAGTDSQNRLLDGKEKKDHTTKNKKQNI